MSAVAGNRKAQHNLGDISLTWMRKTTRRPPAEHSQLALVISARIFFAVTAD
jgi:hypothetical protein